MSIDPREKKAYLSATPMQREAVRTHLGELLSLLRAQSLSYQTSHWQVVGPEFYASHQLFERLYHAVLLQIDQLAEKMVGYLGVESVDIEGQVDKIAGLCHHWGQVSCHHERGLLSEMEAQATIKAAYEGIKKVGAMTLGLDDWLMATANQHEENTYFLQQVRASPPSAKTASTGPGAQLGKLVEKLQRKYPDAKLSFGYLGNVTRWGDDRSWYVFSKLSQPGSYGHKSYKWGGFRTEKLEDLLKTARSNLERAVQKAVAQNDGPYKGHFFDHPEKREVREFADSGALSNNPDIAAEASSEECLDLPTAQVVSKAVEAPPTPSEIIQEPGGAELSSLNRYQVASEGISLEAWRQSLSHGD